MAAAVRRIWPLDFESIPNDVSGKSSDNIELLYMLGVKWLYSNMHFKLYSDTINNISFLMLSVATVVTT